jgi:indole-3-glycerol phosphate synthase
MNILDKIITDKKKEVAQKKAIIPERFLRNREDFKRKCASLKDSLLEKNSTGIIAEFKRKSPSQGWFHEGIVITDVVTAYELEGAAGISVLTDETYFGGSLDDLILAGKVINIPILRKEFIVDEYQVIEAKAWGADVVLLIASCLTKEQVKKFAFKAHEIGLEVLLEVHNEAELEYDCDAVDMIGVNNRNLDTFDVSVQTSFDLITKIPPGKVAVAESGISNPETILSLKRAGFKGFLIGEAFMKKPDPAIAFAEFVNQLKAMQ